ncbi:hypothetical protein AB0M47_04580 [Hamadaea sp. NPDC051192]|uniref:hypothetical protein n=1 Tax=Hamadaea sp. NPDC051192 TaxID=3154940 RepID=UPI003413997F
MRSYAWLLTAALTVLFGGLLIGWNPLGLVIFTGFTRYHWAWSLVLAVALFVLSIAAVVADDSAAPTQAWIVGIGSVVLLAVCSPSITGFIGELDLSEHRTVVAVSSDGRSEAVYYEWSDGSTSAGTVRLRTRAGLLSRESRIDLVCTQPEADYRVEFVQDDRLRIFSGTALLLDTTFDGLEVDHTQPGCP